jgi:micrococcal nuclease
VALQSRDRYRRLLASIWRDGQLVHEQLVQEGLCLPYVVPPNLEYVDRIRAASEHACRDGVGIYDAAQPLLELPREHRRGRMGSDGR